jgi:hypothetical protein
MMLSSLLRAELVGAEQSVAFFGAPPSYTIDGNFANNPNHSGGRPWNEAASVPSNHNTRRQLAALFPGIPDFVTDSE